MTTKKLIAFLLALLLPASCAQAQSDKPIIDTSAMDQNVRPQDDLFRYINGSWLENMKIPEDKADFGSFTALGDQSQTNIKKIIDEINAGKHSGEDARKIADFYKSYMNQEAIEKKGLKPIHPMLRELATLKTHTDVFRAFGKLQTWNVDSPVAFYVGPDAKNASTNIVQILQNGTTLPDRQYYLSDSETTEKLNEALKTYIARSFELAGLQNGEAAAVEIQKLEKRIAEIQWERKDTRNREKIYNKFPIAEFSKKTPSMDWSLFLEDAGVTGVTEFNVWTPSFFENFDGILTSTSVETWIQYLQYRTINSFAKYLSQDIVDARFDLYGKALAGIEVQKPRWKKGIDEVAGTRQKGVLGEAVGKLYVAKHFKPESKAAMKVLVDNLLSAFAKSIDELAWMTPETKVRAHQKLAKINTKIGYPDKWQDYSALSIGPENLFENISNAHKYEYKRMLDRLQKPVDKDEWGMTPQTVNAYYNASLNEIVFPAAILQPPFFDKDAPAGLNYGGIGAVIGHEISHGFDDQGSKFDQDGNMVNWWSDADRKAFEALAQRLVEQYSQYEPLPGRKVNGAMTLGENIGDLSGLAIANKAYRIATEGQNIPKVAGWTGNQLFFVGWSRVWRRKYRDAELIRRLLTDSHSPSEFRTNGPIMNIDAFYEAFNVKEGDMLFKPVEERIKIW